MSSVLWHVTMSLDGFIAGRDDAMEWVFEYPGPNEAVEEVIAATGALVVGRRTYEVEDRYRGGFYGGAWSGPFFVLTHEAPAEAPEWMSGTFVSAGVEDAVARAKSAAGDRDVCVFGASTAAQCLEAGLIDELLVHVAPLLLGEGVRLFECGAARPVRLEKLAASESGPLTNLRFRVLQEPAQN